MEVSFKVLCDLTCLKIRRFFNISGMKIRFAGCEKVVFIV